MESHYPTYSPHDIFASTSKVDLSQLPVQLSSPSQSDLRQHILSHPLLSTRLPSSSALAAQIEALKSQLNEDRAKLEAARDTARTELLTTTQGLAKIRQSLDVLPAEIEDVGDAIDSIARSLGDSKATQTGEVALRATLKKHEDAITSFRSARDYFAILGRAQQLWDAALSESSSSSLPATSKIAGDPQLDALAELSHICQFAASLSLPQSQSQASKLRFLPFLQSKLQETYATLLDRRSKVVRDALAKAEWPPLSAEQAQAQGKMVRTPESILDRADVRAAWTALASLQIVGGSLKLAPMPSCLHTQQLLSVKEHDPQQEGTKSAAAPSPGEQSYVPLLAISLLVEPYLLRFRYHFDSSWSTNRLDKPEWYLDHMLALIKSLLPLFAASPVRGAAVKLSGPALRRYGKHATQPEADLIHVLLAPLKSKVEASVPLLLAQGESTSIFTHTISALTTFDADLQELMGDVGLSDLKPIRMAEDILTREEWFTSWVQGEKISAEEALDSFLENGDAWTISTSDSLETSADGSSAPSKVDAGSSRESKSTLSSRSLALLLQSLTNTYTPLPLLSHRLQFLALIQLPLLRSYAQRLTRSLEAFESLSSAFARAIPGGIEHTSSGALVNTETDMVRGLRGLNRLLKAYLSALHIREQVGKWKESSFFLDMSEGVLSSEAGTKLLLGKREEAEWSELDGESLSGLIRKGLRGSSNANRQDRSAGKPAVAVSSVWDEVIERYEEILERASSGMKRLVVAEVTENLKGYAHMPWLDHVSPLEDQGDDSTSIPTPLLLPALTTLHTHLSHLFSNLPTTRCVPVYRAIASELSSQVVQRVVIAGGSKRFSLAGAHRFLLDYEEGWLSVLSQLQRQATASGPASTRLRVELTGLGYTPSAPWRQLRDVVVLLSLPTEASATPVASADAVAGAEDKTVQRWGDWTLARAVGVLFEEDALRGRVGEEKLRRELRLASWDELGREKLRAVLRRRTDCAR